MNFRAQQTLLVPALSVSIGVLAFLLIVGLGTLDPENIGWLQGGDPATHYLGWAFFRDGEWSLPVGNNPNYGLELSSSVVYSDSIPLLAIFLKPFSHVLPTPFQYFGIWLLSCFILQAWFSWKLLGLVSHNGLFRLVSTGFFVFAPPMIARMFGHLSLAAHFLILAALYLVLIPHLNRRVPLWGALLALTALVHAYILVMIVALWLADLVDRVLRKQLTFRMASSEFLSLAAILILVCWLAGYFVPGTNPSASGFGIYRMNLLSLIDPSGWSYVLRDIPETKGDYEGFNYLGAGVIMLLAFAVPVAVSARPQILRLFRLHPSLIVCVLLLSAFALSSNFAVGPYEYKLIIPEATLRVLNIFQSSGRMFWPVFYLVVLLLVFAISRGYEKRAGIVILVVALLFQIVDTRAGWADLYAKHRLTSGAEWKTHLSDPFWAEAARVYTKVRYIPTQNHPPRWEDLSNYAAEHKLATDVVYLARIRSEALETVRREGLEKVERGNWDLDTLYVLSEREFRKAFVSSFGKSDLVAQIDGFYLIAPGWRSCSSCVQQRPAATMGDLFPPLDGSKPLNFRNTDADVAYLSSGWSTPEAWGTWSEGTKSQLFLPILPSKVRSMTLQASVLVSPLHPSQRVVVLVNGVHALDTRLTSEMANIAIEVPDAVRRDLGVEFLELEFHFPDAAQPSGVGLGGDDRKLALGLRSLEIIRTDEPDM